MSFFPDSSTILQVGGVSISWYALTLVLGATAAYLSMSKVLHSHGYRLSVCEDLLCIFSVCLLIGGRIGWVIENMRSYRIYWWSVFSLMDGGTEIITGFLAVLFGVWVYSRIKRMSWRRTMDSLCPSLYIFLIIARAGRCFAVPGVWAAVALDIIGLAVMKIEIMKYKEGRKRGDVTAFFLLWMGASKMIASVLKLDPMAAECIPFAFLAEFLGLLLFWYNRAKKTDPKPVILLDFDGTLMDSEKMVIECFRHLFELHGNIGDFNRQRQKEVFGLPLSQAVAMLFPEEDQKELIREYREYQMKLPELDRVKMLPHAEDTLRTLHDNGYRLGIVSSRMSESLKMWMDEFRISDLFDLVVGREQFRRPKPAPDGIISACDRLLRAHDDCVYVGDTGDDVLAAKAAGVFAVAYVSDEANREEITAAKPNVIITDLNELLDVVKEDHAWSYDKI